ncbi:hypothetical protein QQG55_9195 [Brugia pahangi]
MIIATWLTLPSSDEIESIHLKTPSLDRKICEVRTMVVTNSSEGTGENKVFIQRTNKKFKKISVSILNANISFI